MGNLYIINIEVYKGTRLVGFETLDLYFKKHEDAHNALIDQDYKQNDFYGYIKSTINGYQYEAVIKELSEGEYK